jgi:folate-binding protein YgfZ
MVPQAVLDSYAAARERSAFFPRSDRAWVVLSGKDRRSYLQGLLTNDIAALGAGQGCYAAYLTAQGRMIAELWVYELGDTMLLSCHADVKDTVVAKLDQFIFSEDVQLGDVTATFTAVAIVGPRAGEVVSGVLSRDPATVALAEHGNLRATFQGRPAILLRTSDLGVPGFDLLVETDSVHALIAALREEQVTEGTEAAAEMLRIEGGVPKFHRDMDEDTIPLEAGIEGRAISLTKGCYVGQEVIIRVLHRGHGRVARKLVGIALNEGDTPATGTSIYAGDRIVGQVTSAAWSPVLRRPVALGYVHRDFVAPGTPVRVSDQTAEVVALPIHQ